MIHYVSVTKLAENWVNSLIKILDTFLYPGSSSFFILDLQ